MVEASREEIGKTVERLIEDVGSWPGVTVAEHRFDGTEWRVGPREIGHVHSWGMLDVAYLRALRDALIEAGKTGVHHLLDESGWTTFSIEHPDDYDHAGGSSDSRTCITSTPSGKPLPGPRSTPQSMSKRRSRSST